MKGQQDKQSHGLQPTAQYRYTTKNTVKTLPDVRGSGYFLGGGAPSIRNNLVTKCFELVPATGGTFWLRNFAPCMVFERWGKKNGMLGLRSIVNRLKTGHVVFFFYFVIRRNFTISLDFSGTYLDWGQEKP